MGIEYLEKLILGQMYNYKQYFTLDTDVPLLPKNCFSWSWMALAKRKSLDYAEDFRLMISVLKHWEVTDLKARELECSRTDARPGSRTARELVGLMRKPLRSKGGMMVQTSVSSMLSLGDKSAWSLARWNSFAIELDNCIQKPHTLVRAEPQIILRELPEYQNTCCLQ